MLLRDAISIPEHVSASDFVLKLDSGVEHAGTTVAQYVVTENLAEAFDKALSSVGSAFTSGGDRGSFVHGSFGSGKSHFMAILHLLLSGDPGARALPGLQASISSHESVMAANLLTLDFHLIGADSLESALFSGYLRQVALLHPDAVMPVLHNTVSLFLDARSMRETLGDVAFFEKLNSGAASGWGDFGTGWDSDSFDAAMAEDLDGESRGRLASVLVTNFFRSYSLVGQWVGIETGLKLITSHAKSLGYSAVVLFLDELVLWLASHLADTEFVSTEGTKVAKLVETGAGSRAVPIVSFVARQRDLKDFLGESVPGAEQMAVGQTFTWWEDRFDTIKLDASDLQEIANKRLLQPVSAEAEAALASGLARVKSNARAWDDLLRDENGADEAAFAKVYPFSPALVDTLVTLSGLLQRERTALKVMAQLLVKGRDYLTVTDVIPVGDLYDAMVEGGDTPLTDEMRSNFSFARELYRIKLRPILLASHNLTEIDVEGSRPGALAEGASPAVAAFFTDDRLAKTLLIAALAPRSPALINLTASRLAYLNYGTVAAPIPGTEAVTVLNRVRTWADQIGEIQISDGDNPVISIAISGVDYDSVINQVRNEDTVGARRGLLRRMVFEQLGMSDSPTLLTETPFALTWRGSKRTIDLVFGNVRNPDEIPDDILRANGANWKLLIDYPFDDADHGPNDDIARIERLRASGVNSRTVAWIPLFLSSSRQDDLGTLVLLEHLLAGAGDNFDKHATHLPTEHRQVARATLTNRRNSLRESIGSVIKQAYGTATAEPRDIDTSYGEINPFTTLSPGLNIQPPVAANLRGALASLTDQMLSSQFPDHPLFIPSESEIKRSELNTVAEHVARAMSAGGRVDPVETAKRGAMMRVANPLKVGEMLENHYVFSAANFLWRNHFAAFAAKEKLSAVPVSQARASLASYGMDRSVENLLLIAWALLEDKQWSKSGATISVSAVEQVTDDLVLREPALPEVEAWDSAVPVAAALFGVTVSTLRSAANLTALGAGVRARARELQPASVELLKQLTEHAVQLGISLDSARFVSAALGAELLGRLANENDDVVLVTTLFELPLPEEPQSLARSMISAAVVSASLRGLMWNMLDSISGISVEDPRRVDVDQLFATLAGTARAQELHDSLGPALSQAVVRAGHILSAGGVVAPPVQPVPPVPPVVPVNPDLPAAHVNDVSLDGIDQVFGQALLQARAALEKNPERKLNVHWWLE